MRGYVIFQALSLHRDGQVAKARMAISLYQIHILKKMREKLLQRPKAMAYT